MVKFIDQTSRVVERVRAHAPPPRLRTTALGCKETNGSTYSKLYSLENMFNLHCLKRTP